MTLPLVLAAFAVSCIATPVIRGIGRRAGVIDVPNERSSHAIPTPRGGGIAILLGVATAGLAVSFDSSLLLLGACTLLIAIAGLVDDIRSLGALPRFLTHCVAAALPIWLDEMFLGWIAWPWDGVWLLGWLGIPVTLVFLVGMTNAYNFMDGINGIASMEAIVAALALAILSLQIRDLSAAIVAGALAGAAAGFLPWNFPKASIFMGDVGSGAIGFLLAALAVRYAVQGAPIIAAVLPLLPFLLDTGVTLVRRILRGERFYAAHRSHFYQRLNALGWSHAAVTLLWSGLALLGAIVSVVYTSLTETQRTIAVAVLLLIHVGIGIAITRRELSSPTPRT